MSSAAQTRPTANRTSTERLIFITACVASFITIANLCSTTPLASASAAPTPQIAVVPTELFNACSIFSASDAQQIMGVPMVPKAGTRSQNVCMYQEAAQRANSMMQGTLSLTVNRRKSAVDEDKGWASVKEVRHLKAGEKNVQPLTGIGQEAYFTGNAQKGKVGVAAVVVRKGNFDFALDSMVMEYVASPEAMKTAAKAIAEKLQ
jgi:hypothetical protein